MRRLPGGTLALGLSIVVVACGTSTDEEITPQVREAVMARGGDAAKALLGTLVSQLKGAMQEGGAANAVDFCSTTALGLTSGVAEEHGLEIKRTSMRYRNPANAPDQDETAALKYFESTLAETGELPDSWVQRAGRDEYRFYRPLVVGAPCLACHGPAGQIDPSVQEVLAERYPDDLATGYELGDFRGVIRVSVPADQVESAGG
jgi:hypothetical protein